MITPAESLARVRAQLSGSRLYTAAQIAKVIGLDVGNVHRAISDGRLKARMRGPFMCYGHQVVKWAAKRAAKVKKGSGVTVVANSKNAKLGQAAVTIVARQSCPTSCAFHQKGCYAEHDNNRVIWDRITAGAMEATPLDLARAEAAAIDGLPGDRDLRLHVAGDSTTDEGTRLIAAACARYVERGRQLGLAVRVWAYTHAWRTVPRDAWGTVSILASCETGADVLLARARGYAAAIVVPEFASDVAHEVDGVKVVPCPQQTRDRVCTDCRLCFNDARLAGATLAIGFAVHGWGSRKAVSALRRVALPMVA